MSDNSQTHNHSHKSIAQQTQQAILLAFAINTVFLCIELFGAVYADSLTLLADAFHMLTDSASLLLALLASYLAEKSADKLRTFGYQRAEVIGGLLNGLFLIGTVLFIVYDAYHRLQTQLEVQSEIVILVGTIGLGANLLAAYVLRSNTQSVNVRGAYLHLVADAFGSIAAIISGVIIYFTKFYLVDVVFALIIAGIILWSVKSLLYDAVHILMQGTPTEVDLSEIEHILSNIDGVVDVHHIHLWSISSVETAVSAHIVVDDPSRNSEILDEALSILKSAGVDHPTLQVEGPDFNMREHNCYEHSRK